MRAVRNQDYAHLELQGIMGQVASLPIILHSRVLLWDVHGTMSQVASLPVMLHSKGPLWDVQGNKGQVGAPPTIMLHTECLSGKCKALWAKKSP